MKAPTNHWPGAAILTKDNFDVVNLDDMDEAEVFGRLQLLGINYLPGISVSVAKQLLIQWCSEDSYNVSHLP